MADYYKRLLANFKGRVTRIKNNLEKDGPRLSELELNSFHKLLQSFVIPYSEALANYAVKDPTAANEIQLDEFDEYVFEQEQHILRLLNNLKQKQNNDDFKPKIHMSLPLEEIPIPTFDGNYLQWHTFKEIYLELIHENNNLSINCKFNYLRTSLKDGNAFDFIRGLSATTANYKEVWESLVKHFEDDNRILYFHMEEIFNLKPIREDAKEVLMLATTIKRHYNALKSLGISVESWDLFFIVHLIRITSGKTRKELELLKIAKTVPTTLAVLEVLSNRARIMEAISDNNSTASNCKISNQSSKSTSRNSSSTFLFKKTFNQSPNLKSSIQNPSIHKPSFVSTTVICAYCKDNHSIFQCQKFTTLPWSKKYEWVKNDNLCRNCFGNHITFHCKSIGCKICSRRHHTLLHHAPENNSTKISNDSSQPSNERSQPSTFNQPTIQSAKLNLVTSTIPESLSTSSQTDEEIKPHFIASATTQVLLSTAIIWAISDKGVKLPCRALIDQGSMSNFITESFVQKMQLSRHPTCVPVSGIKQQSFNIKHYTSFTILSRISSFQIKSEFLILPKFSTNLPLQQFKFDINSIRNDIQLADPSFNIPQKIDIILGADIFSKIVCGEKLMINKDLPPLINTSFGYVLCGKINDNIVLPTISLNCCNIEILNQQIEKFFHAEKISPSQCLSVEEKACEEHYVNNVQRDTDGRYIVALPTKNNVSQLGDSYQNAFKQFQTLERKLNQHSQLNEEYCKFINEYIAMNHMKLIKSPTNNISYFLPHHAVYKENSTTTKLRVVFNGSTKTTSGLSLNDVLMTGPKIQNDIFNLLINFRQHHFGLVADIAKMYRQILVREPDRALQQILWRNNSSDPISVYQLNTVTYGTTSAPFAAIRTLKQLANDECSSHPEAANILLQDFYVDDLVTGGKTLIETTFIKNEISILLNKGGFNLRKFASNAQELADSELKNSTSINVLGMIWNTRDDYIFYPIFNQCPDNYSFTKRSVLSVIAQIFDPLGYLAPVVFIGKHVMQQAWKTIKIEWDEELPEPLLTTWKEFVNQLPALNHITIPRCIFSHNEIASIELHGFGDASEKGFGCCIYIRCISVNNYQTCNLLCSKSRVIPSKKHTIPRLELCASLLLAQLLEKVKNSFKIKFNRLTLWSDSEITLFRINSSPSKYCTFVANRVSKIQDIAPPNSWSFIPTELNPSDIVSRGLMPRELKKCSMWWNGPKFLTDPNEPWPTTNKQFSNINNDPELSSISTLLEINIDHDDFMLKFSNYTKLLRVTAILLRFIHNCKQKPCKRKTGKILIIDLNNAFKKIIQIIQSKYYSTEIQALKSNKAINNRSSLKRLNPFLDTEQLLRVGGRLTNSDLTYNQIHPFLLPANHHFSQLYVRHEHFRNLHAGPISLLSYTRQKIWIINGRTLCRKIVFQCIRCFRTRPQSIEQLMGDLPPERVKPTRPFTNVGVDFCGPFMLKQKIRSNVITKVYIALFVCFTSKACHLEVVTDLSTNAFIMALRRFIARRGRCSTIYSDNATNFIGARNELIDLQKLFNNELHRNELNKFLTEENINWHTIPPRSPHFGGLWEAAIKSAKYHLKRVLGNNLCTLEELFTLSTQIEACLNSRPLHPMSNDPSDYSVLTPGHFLIGEPLNLLPEPSLSHLDENRLSHYQRLQLFLQKFWQRWSTEYLTELQIRPKWLNSSKNLTTGTLVLLKEDNLPPIKWLMGRVIETHPGKDNLIRVVSIKTSTGTFKRALSRICVLPIDTASPCNGNNDLNEI